MAISAVPEYLGQDFSTASPSLRFGMYFKVWGINRRSQQILWGTDDVDYKIRGQNRQERETKINNKVPALAEAKKLTTSDKERMHKILERQRHTFEHSVSPTLGFMLNAQATAPFTTGLGNEHPLDNGFAFLNPYGLPYLPGSGVKGVLRQAARELASGEWGDTHGWSDEKNIPLMQGEGDKCKPVLDSKKRPVILSMLDILFGRETADGDSEHLRGVLSFWDVIPQIKDDSLMVEIMTPHQPHYYQQKAAAGSTTPHDSGQPTPISFLTVPPGSKFTFHVVCDLRQLQRLTADRLEGAPDLLAEGDTHWKKLLEAAFELAFDWCGFGAKTAVGYGAMKQLSNKEIEEDRRKAEAASRKCDWVDDTIQKIAEKNNARIDDVLRSKALAEAWRDIPDASLKEKALIDIRARWKNRPGDWWESPPGRSARQAKSIYEGGES